VDILENVDRFGPYSRQIFPVDESSERTSASSSSASSAAATATATVTTTTKATKSPSVHLVWIFLPYPNYHPADRVLSYCRVFYQCNTACPQISDHRKQLFAEYFQFSGHFTGRKVKDENSPLFG